MHLGVPGGTLDVAISRPPLVDDLDCDLLGSEGVVIALPDGHRLARKDDYDSPTSLTNNG